MFSVRISPRCYIIVALGFLVGHLFKKIDHALFHDPYLQYEWKGGTQVKVQMSESTLVIDHVL
jgi:hypothetical protein